MLEEARTKNNAHIFKKGSKIFQRLPVSRHKRPKHADQTNNNNKKTPSRFLDIKQTNRHMLLPSPIGTSRRRQCRLILPPACPSPLSRRAIRHPRLRSHIHMITSFGLKRRFVFIFQLIFFPCASSDQNYDTRMASGAT